MRALLWVALLVFAGLVGYALISPRNSTPPAGAAGDAPAAPTIVGTVKEIMQGVVDPASDVIFESVSTTISAAGIVEKRPQNDEEWATVEHNALLLAEAMNLITDPQRVIGHPNEMNGGPAEPNAPELTPAQIQEKVSADRVLFGRYAARLQEGALKAREAARAKSVDGLLESGSAIDVACENCHLYYWYPKKGVAAPEP